MRYDIALIPQRIVAIGAYAITLSYLARAALNDGPDILDLRESEKCPMSLCFDQQVTFLYVKDLEISERFYGKILELELVLNQGLARIYRVGSGNAFLGICLSSAVQQAPPPDRAPLGVIVTFVVNDVEGAYSALRAKGVAFEKPPAINTTYNIYNCFFRDPDGYLLEIQKFLSPDWPHPVACDAVVGRASNRQPGGGL